MSIVKIWQTHSLDSVATLKIGERLGSACRGGEIIVLNSDLGGGKTTFVKGLAKGMGSTDKVGSPTFTINRVYKCANGKTLQHFDFYRLNDAGVVALELAEVLNDPKAVIAIEWGNIIKGSLPADRLEIELKLVAANADERDLVFSYPESYEYLLGKLK